MVRWHCPPDTEFEIWALAVWGRARYLSVTEAPHNTDFYTWMGKKHFLFLSNRLNREPRTLAWKWAVLTTTLGPPPVRLFRIPMLWAYGHYIQYTLYRRGYVLSNLIIASVKLFSPVSIVFFRLCIVAEQCRGGHACRPLAGKLIAKCWRFL